jgi:outer membrane protein assembly factor BamB
MRGLSSRSLLAVLLIAPAAQADDWPQWMGPDRDAVWKETGIVEKFPEGGPKKLWSTPVHQGYAGPAVANGKVYVTDWTVAPGAKASTNPFAVETAVPGTERVLCLDARTGKELWKHEYKVDYKVSYAYGPRCTPTVSGGKVYALGTMGDLVCLDAEKGTPVWKKDFKADYKAETPLWGFCGHPLAYQNLLVCLVGGPDALVVAFEKDTGKEVWKALRPAKPKEPGYAPPTLMDLNGVEQVVMYAPTAVTGLDPKSGKSLWSVKTEPGRFGMAIMAPRESGDRVYAASNEAAVAFEVKPGAEPAELWRAGGKRDAKGINPVNMTPFVDGDTIYGVDQPGMLRAVDLKTGKRLWYAFEPVIEKEEEETFQGAGSGTAFLVKNGDRFFLFNEKGSLIIANLSPEGYKEIDKAKLLEPTGAAFGRKVVWSHPAFAEKCVFVRNDKEIACFSLAKE